MLILITLLILLSSTSYLELLEMFDFLVIKEEVINSRAQC